MRLDAFRPVTVPTGVYQVQYIVHVYKVHKTGYFASDPDGLQLPAQ